MQQKIYREEYGDTIGSLFIDNERRILYLKSYTQYATILIEIRDGDLIHNRFIGDSWVKDLERDVRIYLSEYLAKPNFWFPEQGEIQNWNDIFIKAY